jgi:hypothetical protein
MDIVIQAFSTGFSLYFSMYCFYCKNLLEEAYDNDKANATHMYFVFFSIFGAGC